MKKGIWQKKTERCILKALMNSGEISSSDCWTVPVEKVCDGKDGEGGNECQRVCGVGRGVGSGVNGCLGRGGFVGWLWVGVVGWQLVVIG